MFWWWLLLTRSVFGFDDPFNGAFDWEEPPGGDGDETRGSKQQVGPGSPYGPGSMSGSPHGPDSMSYGPGSMSRSPYGPGSMHGSMPGSPYGPGTMSGSPYVPGPGSGSMSGSPYEPGPGPGSLSGFLYGQGPGSLRESSDGQPLGADRDMLREGLTQNFNHGPLPRPKLNQMAGHPNPRGTGMPDEKEVDDMERLITKHGRWPEFVQRLQKEMSKFKDGEVDPNWEDSLKDWVEWTKHLNDSDSFSQPDTQPQPTLRPILHVAEPKLRSNPSVGYGGYWGASEEYIPAYALRSKPEPAEETEESPDVRETENRPGFSVPQKYDNPFEAEVHKIEERAKNQFQPTPEQQFTWKIPPPPNDEPYAPPLPPPSGGFGPLQSGAKSPYNMPQFPPAAASGQPFNVPSSPNNAPQSQSFGPQDSSRLPGLPGPEKPISPFDQVKAPVPLRDGPPLRQENQKPPDANSMIQMILKKISVLENRVSGPPKIKTTTEAPTKPVNPMSLIKNARRDLSSEENPTYALRSYTELPEEIGRNLDFSDPEHIHNTIQAAVKKIEDESGISKVSWAAAQSQFQPKPDGQSAYSALNPPPPDEDLHYAPPQPPPSDGFAPLPPGAKSQDNIPQIKSPAAYDQPFNVPMSQYDAPQSFGYETLDGSRLPGLPRPEKPISPYDQVKAPSPLRNGSPNRQDNTKQPDNNSEMKRILEKISALENRLSEPVNPGSRRVYAFDDTIMRMAMQALKDGTANKSHEMLRQGAKPINLRDMTEEERQKILKPFLEPPTTEAELHWPLSEMEKSRHTVSAMSPDEFISTRHAGGGAFRSRRKNYAYTAITQDVAMKRLEGAFTPPPPDSNEVLDLFPPDMKIAEELLHPTQRKSYTTTINPFDLAPFADFFGQPGSQHSRPDRTRRQEYPIQRFISRRAEDDYEVQLAIAKKKVQEMEQSEPNKLKDLLDRQSPPVGNIPPSYADLPSLGPGFPPNRPSPSNFEGMPQDLVRPVSVNNAPPPGVAYGGMPQDNSQPNFQNGVASPNLPPNFSYGAMKPPNTGSGSGPNAMPSPSLPGSLGAWGNQNRPPSGEQGTPYKFPPDFEKKLQEMQASGMQPPQMHPPVEAPLKAVQQARVPMPELNEGTPYKFSPDFEKKLQAMQASGMQPPQMRLPVEAPLKAVRQALFPAPELNDRPQVSSSDLMTMLMKKLEGLETRLDERDRTSTAPPKILPGFPVDEKAKKTAMRAKETREEMEFFKKLPFEDDNAMPIRWVKYNSNETEDGLAKVTDLQTGKNMQFIFHGTYYVPVVDLVFLRMGNKMELTTQPSPLSFSTENNALKTVLENVDMNKPKPEDWLAYETVLGKFPKEDTCEEESCQSGCHRTGCQSMCEGDSCKVGCVGPGCSAYCKGPGCSAMCIGERCSARCDGMTCDSRCRGNNCDAVCSLFSCMFTINGISQKGKGTYEDWYPDHTRYGENANG